MRICSLLPSITEVLFELGRGGEIVGVTHECDWPAAALAKPKLTRSRLRGEGCSSAEIDRQVREQTGSLYDLDAELLARLQPDLIFTQSLCPVCAVDERMVRDVAAVLPSRPEVVSYHPTCLQEVLTMIDEIGRSTNTSTAAHRLTDRFHDEIARVREMCAGAFDRPHVVCLEWSDPPFACGHWTPELVELAGGTEVLGRVRQPSRRVGWDELVAAQPSVLLLAPCGFTLDRTLAEMGSLKRHAGWDKLPAVQTGRAYCTDGSAYFNRPGPRLIESLQILAEVIHPSYFEGLAPPGSFQRVP
jgi:iron complex transport system substrate-binding protein